MCSREEKIAIEIKEEFCRRVIPSHITRYLKCITTQDAEKVKAVEKQDGPISAAEILLERLVRRPDWLNDLKRVFLIEDVGLLDFGEKLEEKCRQLIVTVCATEDCIYGHGCGEKVEETLVKSLPTDEVKMCTQEEEIANEIKDEFCCRVIPSGIIRYLSCLTIQDTENVTTAEKQLGPIYAAEILLERLVRRPDWLHDLKRVLLIPDVGLLDFGEKLEDKYYSKIPEQIKKMDHESIDIYLNALESGSERRRDINLIIVGKKSVGKTSLVRRLFGEELQSVKSTNGIEIHRRRCRIDLSNCDWNKVLDTRFVEEKSNNNRILQSIVKELHQDKEKPKHDMLEIFSSDQISTDDNKGTITKNIEHDEEPQPKHAKMNYQFAYPEITEPPISKRAKDELLSIVGSVVDLQDEDGFANLTVWDFAGDIEYYNTHQTFLNSEAIFLVVANLHDIDDTESYGTFNFWMDTIHCYGSINDKTEAVLLEGAHNLLDPPVIAIGTHKDKFQDEEQCRKSLESYTDKIFKDSKLHLRSIHLISNTEDEEDAFGKLRNDIFSNAKSSTNWNQEYPVKFIQMEKAINSELTIGKQIISFERLKELGEKIPLPITDNKELHLFLRYQHEIGKVIFFEDIPSYIILDPQWLANAFTCIVTAQQFQLELPHLQWDNFKQTGKMDPKLLEEIFKKQSADMRIHKEHILEVIEKFDIIIYPLLLRESGNVQREHSVFYVPCMLQTLKIKDIDVLFNVPNASKSTCLCFVFSFLPPYLISNLIVSCLREYPLAVVKGEIGLFKDCCVFNIDRTGCAKFVLAKSSHMIQLQVWQWDEIDTEVNQAVLKIVEREINRIVNTRYKLKTVSFEKKWKCETTSFSFDTGFLEFDQVNDGENYYCEEHATVHKYKDYWSGEKSKASRRISSDQQNYVRMSMIVLEVLSGVLYDRLYIDTKTGEILDRDKLDITEMCRKYCALKINFPSKGFRKIEKVDEISTIEDTIGDDIQRIRVIRNEMQHSSVFALDDTRYQTLITIVHDMLTRFDQRNNPAGESYVKRLDEIRKMEIETRSFEEIKERMKAGLKEKMHAVIDSMVSDALNDIC